MHSASLDMSVRFSVPAEYVWYVLTTPSETAHWWPDLQLTRRKGSKVHLVTPRPRKKRPRTMEGKVISAAKQPYIRAFVRATPRGYTTELTLQVAQLASATRLRIIETEFPDVENAGVIVSECREGWRSFVAALADHLENPATLARLRATLDGEFPTR